VALGWECLGELLRRQPASPWARSACELFARLTAMRCRPMCMEGCGTCVPRRGVPCRAAVVWSRRAIRWLMIAGEQPCWPGLGRNYFESPSSLPAARRSPRRSLNITLHCLRFRSHASVCFCAIRILIAPASSRSRPGHRAVSPAALR
jgi:hypothetical protein